MLNLKKKAKYFLLLPIISATLFAGIANAKALKTKTFNINMKANCEGQPVCVDHIYVLKNLKTGKLISLAGKAIYANGGVDSIPPDRLLRHEFRSKQYLYRITADNKLQVFKSGKLILQEQGTLSQK